jgi:hypothetical protein
MTAQPVERARPARDLRGRTTPRLWTPPKRRLSPATSRGYACVAFAESVGIELFPWQRWLLVHALELNRDGTYRFRVVVVLVARQNGKTTLLKVLALWRMLEDGARMVVGTSTNMEYAREAWAETVETAQGRDLRLARERAVAAIEDPDDVPEDPDELLAYLPRRERWCRSIKRGALDTSLTLAPPSPGDRPPRYKVASASRTGGRSLAIDLGIADELREHRPAGDLTGWEAWAALDGATTARPNSQVYGLSNAGDRGSVVLNHFRSVGHAFIETGQGDDTLGLFEWSAADDCDLLDRRQWAQANPALGYGTISEATLASKAQLPAAVFRTEHLCQGVPTLRAAVDVATWRAGADPAGTLDGLRARVALCLDVAEDLEHVTLVAAAALDDGRVRAEVVAAWSSVEAARTATRDAPSLWDWIRRVRPRLVGWFPAGPAAVLDVELTKAYPEDKGRIRGRRLVGGAQSSACQGLAEQVKAGRILHPDDPLLNTHVIGVSKQQTGDGWRFVRRDAGHVDAAYALAGAVHLARSMPRLRAPKFHTAG